MWFVFALSAAALWAITNVMDSMLVKRYEKDPAVIMWFNGFIKLIILAGLFSFIDVRTTWMVPLLLLAIPFYIGALLYFYLVDRMDISVMNAAWAIEAIFLSAVGFYFFGERWSFLQSTAAVLILSGVFLLSYWHKHVSVLRTVFLLALLGLLFVPEESVKKAAILDHQDVLAVLFWSLLGNASLTFLCPWLSSNLRQRAKALLQRADLQFYLFFIADVVTGLLAWYCIVQAYARGPISLVSISGSVQPFLTLFFAWIFYRFIPQYAPRELLTLQSVQVKIVSFIIVFIGLALLAFTQ